MALARARIVLAALLMAGAAACTSGTPKAPAAADTAVPKQVLPSPPAWPTPSNSAWQGASALPRSEATAQYARDLRVIDVDHLLDDRSDADLLAAGDGVCSRLRDGRPVPVAVQWLESQGYSSGNPVDAVMAVALRDLCIDQRKKYGDWVHDGAPGG